MQLIVLSRFITCNINKAQKQQFTTVSTKTTEREKPTALTSVKLRYQTDFDIGYDIDLRHRRFVRGFAPRRTVRSHRIGGWAGSISW